MPSNASAFSHMLMQILLLCRHPAADVPLGLVDIQHLARLRRERRVDLRETLGDVLMYGCNYLYRSYLQPISFRLSLNLRTIASKYQRFHLYLLRFFG